jgi:hypothetical protein
MTNVQGKVTRRIKTATYEQLLSDVSSLLEAARRQSAQSVNAILTATYWLIGRRIVEYEQRGKERAEYGTELLNRLANDLSGQFGRGFSRQNIQQMRQFFLSYQTPKICQTLSGKSSPNLICQTPSALLNSYNIANLFPLSWSHYVRLLSVNNRDARSFYECEALRGGWSVRQLDRQISTQFYERTLLSKNKSSMFIKGAKPLENTPCNGMQREWRVAFIFIN